MKTVSRCAEETFVDKGAEINTEYLGCSAETSIKHLHHSAETSTEHLGRR